MDPQSLPFFLPSAGGQGCALRSREESYRAHPQAPRCFLNSPQLQVRSLLHPTQAASTLRGRSGASGARDSICTPAQLRRPSLPPPCPNAGPTLPWHLLEVRLLPQHGAWLAGTAGQLRQRRVQSESGAGEERGSRKLPHSCGRGAGGGEENLKDGAGRGGARGVRYHPPRRPSLVRHAVARALSV